MLPQLLKTVGRFRKRRPVTNRHPPKNGLGLGRMSEPLSTTLHDFGVDGVIHIFSQCIESAPYGHIDYDVVAKGAQGRGIPLIGLEAPPKPIRGVRKQIDTVEIGYKVHEYW